MTWAKGIISIIGRNKGKSMFYLFIYVMGCDQPSEESQNEKIRLKMCTTSRDENQRGTDNENPEDSEDENTEKRIPLQNLLRKIQTQAPS